MLFLEVVTVRYPSSRPNTREFAPAFLYIQEMTDCYTRKIFSAFAILLISSFQAVAQDAWFELSTINNDPDYPFKTEKNIEGICFIVPSPDLNYYKKPIVLSENGKEFLRIEFSESKGMVTTYKGTTHFAGDTTSTFRPWLYTDNANQFNLAMECTDTAGAFYKVRLNAQDLAFISKRNKDFKKMSLEQFTERWTSAGFDFDRKQNPLRKSASDTAEIISNDEQNKFPIWPAKTLEAKGDWLKIKTVKGEEGWIRWKEGDRVLIRMYFNF